MLSSFVVKASIAAALSVGLLSGCSAVGTLTGAAVKEADKPSAKALWENSVAASKGAKSAHLVGQMEDNGQSMTMDLRGTLDGTNQVAKIKSGAEGDVEYHIVDQAMYINMPAMTKGKFLKNDKLDKEITDLSVATLLDKMTGEIKFNLLDELATKIEEIDFNGRPAFKMSSTGSKEFIVVEKESNFLLSLDGGDGKNTFTFSEWNQVPLIVAPSPEQMFKG